ncbi:MAG: thiaminase II [Kiloniellales bacterium]|nr:thiaminase II [Kiloniellales bacterium]
MTSLFDRLKASCRDDWRAYVTHPFVERLGDGSLPLDCFKHYLGQDYIFLMHFARAYALAVFKSEHLDDMRQAAGTLDALLNSEMSLHVTFCARWGLDEDALLAVPEAEANMAYTRLVLERGLAGDLLDLLVALAPCVVGYGEIGARLMAEHGEGLSNNPYREWVETYAGEEYQGVVRSAIEQLDRVAERRLGARIHESPRWHSLAATFRAATRLEAGFWEMGLNP